MKYKLLAIDVDGTLVNNKKEITKATIDAISKAQKAGIKVIIASGRPLKGIKKYNEYFEYDSLFITYNGSVVVKKDTETKILNICITKESLKTIINYIFAKKLHFILWANDNLYVDEINEQILYYETTSGTKAIKTNIDSLVCYEVNKIILYGSFEEICNYKEDIIKMNLDVNLEFSTTYYLEIFDKNASKGLALETIRKYLQLTKEEVCAIGDNYNDVSMLNKAGLSIAMGNSPEDIKKMCDFVTKTNEEDGVAYAINNYILGGNN